MITNVLPELIDGNFNQANIICKDNWQIKVSNTDNVLETDEYLTIQNNKTRTIINKRQIIKIVMK